MHLRPAFACASLARIAGAARSSLSHGVAPSRRSSGPPPRPHDFGSASAEPAYPPPAARLRRNAIARVVRRAARCAAPAPAPAPAAVPPAGPARRQPAAISTEHAQRTTAAHASVRRGVAAHARHVRRRHTAEPSLLALAVRPHVALHSPRAASILKASAPYAGHRIIRHRRRLLIRSLQVFACPAVYAFSFAAYPQPAVRNVAQRSFAWSTLCNVPR